MKRKYKLYQVNRFILLSSYGDDFCTLYENYPINKYEQDRKIIMKIKEDQCTRIIRKYGKCYYRIYIREA